MTPNSEWPGIRTDGGAFSNLVPPNKTTPDSYGLLFFQQDHSASRTSKFRVKDLIMGRAEQSMDKAKSWVTPKARLLVTRYGNLVNPNPAH